MHFEPSSLLLISLLLVGAAFALGAVDGVYFHLQRFRLFAHAETRTEHMLHTLRALLAMPALALLYLSEPDASVLWLAAIAVAADQALLVADLWVERKSRARMGGIPHAEYMIHVTANGLHAVGLALAFASHWSGAAALPDLARWFVVTLLVASGIATVQHLLLLHGASRRCAHALSSGNARDGLGMCGDLVRCCWQRLR